MRNKAQMNRRESTRQFWSQGVPKQTKESNAIALSLTGDRKWGAERFSPLDNMSTPPSGPENEHKNLVVFAHSSYLCKSATEKTQMNPDSGTHVPAYSPTRCLLFSFFSSLSRFLRLLLLSVPRRI